MVDGCVRFGLAGAAAAHEQLQLHAHCLRSLVAAFEARARAALSPEERVRLSALESFGLAAQDFKQLAAERERQLLQHPPLAVEALGGTPPLFPHKVSLSDDICCALVGGLTSALAVEALCATRPYAPLVQALGDASGNCLDAQMLLDGCVRSSLACPAATVQQLELRRLCVRCLAAALEAQHGKAGRCAPAPAQRASGTSGRQVQQHQLVAHAWMQGAPWCVCCCPACSHA